MKEVYYKRKPLPQVTLGDVQAFADLLSRADQDLQPSSQSRILSSVKSLLAFEHRIGVLTVNVGAPQAAEPA